MQRGVEPLAELVHGPAGRLVGDDYLMQLPAGRAADGATAAHLAVDGVYGRLVAVLDGQQVVGLLAGAARRNVRRFETMLDDGLGLAFVQPVDAIDDAGLDGPAAVQCCQAGVIDVWFVLELLLEQVIVLLGVVFWSWFQGRDWMPALRHDYSLAC